MILCMFEAIRLSDRDYLEQNTLPLEKIIIIMMNKIMSEHEEKVI